MIKLQAVPQQYGYICVYPSPQDRDWINQQLEKLDLPSVEGLHCTLAYDKTNPLDYKQILTVPHKATIYDLGSMGEGTRWGTMALLLDSNSLHKRHNQLRELGFEWSWPDYIPHISLGYGLDEEQKMYLYENRENFIGKNIVLNNEHWDICKDEG